MKLKQIVLSCLIAFALIVASNLGLKSLSNDSSNISPLLMEGIEALSEGDDNTSTWVLPDGIESGRFECGARLSNGKKCTFIVITCQGGGKGCNPRPCNIHG